MTSDTSHITLFQQICFFLKKPPHIRIYIGVLEGRRVGYLLLRKTPATTWITEVVMGSMRGRGIASQLVRFAQGECPHLTAEILTTNEASVRLHEACGFHKESEQDGKAVYAWRA